MLRRCVKEQREGAFRYEISELTRVDRIRDVGNPGAPGLLRGLTSGAPPTRERLRAARPVLPFDDAAASPPRHDDVDARLGRQLDRQLAPVALDECLREHDSGLWLGFRPSTINAQSKGFLALNRFNDASGRISLTVSDDKLLPDL